MHVILVNDYAKMNGGAAQVAIASARMLADRGINVTFVFGVGPADEQLVHPNIKLVGLEQYDLLSNPSKLNAAVKGVWNSEVVKEMESLLAFYDSSSTIVHVHSWVKSLSSSVVATALRGGFAVVITLHDYFTICPNGGLYNYQTKTNCTKKPMSAACWASNCDARNYLQKMWRVLRQAVSVGAGVPGRVVDFISVSSFSARLISPHLPKHSILWDVPNPIDIERSDCGNAGDENVFSFVGRLSPEKGAMLFAEAGKKAGVQVRFVGAGSLTTILKSAYPEAEFTGWASRENVLRYIRQSRAVVFPSELYETQGLVVAEAAAIGIPVIVADNCAASDFVEDGKTGLLFASGDCTSLSEKIGQLARDPMLAAELGRNAYDRYWAEPPDSNYHIGKLMTCYRGILGRS